MIYLFTLALYKRDTSESTGISLCGDDHIDITDTLLVSEDHDTWQECIHLQAIVCILHFRYAQQRSCKTIGLNIEFGLIRQSLLDATIAPFANCNVLVRLPFGHETKQANNLEPIVFPLANRVGRTKYYTFQATPQNHVSQSVCTQ